MGTKENPAPNDCYTKAADDEPMFTLLARDPLAPGLVRDWAAHRHLTRGPSEKVDEALVLAHAMEEWRAEQTWCGICGKRLPFGSEQVMDVECGPCCPDHYDDDLARTSAPLPGDRP